MRTLLQKAISLAGDRGGRSQLARTLYTVAVLGPMAILLPTADAIAQGGPRWFSAWTVSHNLRETTPNLSNSYAKATFRKDRRLNIRLSSKDLEAIQKRALADGLPTRR